VTDLTYDAPPVSCRRREGPTAVPRPSTGAALDDGRPAANVGADHLEDATVPVVTLRDAHLSAAFAERIKGKCIDVPRSCAEAAPSA